MSKKINDALRNECQAALDTLAKLNLPETAELQSKLAWCIGSYDHDKNASGLHEYGVVALETLKTLKAGNPRKITKKSIDGLAASLQDFEGGKKK